MAFFSDIIKTFNISKPQSFIKPNSNDYIKNLLKEKGIKLSTIKTPQVTTPITIQKPTTNFFGDLTTQFISQQTPIVKVAEKSREDLARLTFNTVKTLTPSLGAKLFRTKEQEQATTEKYKNYKFSDIGKDLVNLGLNWTLNPLTRMALTAQELATGKKTGVGAIYGFKDAKTFEQEMVGSYQSFYSEQIKNGSTPLSAGYRTALMAGFDLLMGVGIAKQGLPLARKAVSTLPESLLNKLIIKKIPADEIINTLTGSNPTEGANNFIKNLPNEERIALWRVAREYEKLKLPVEITSKEPTALGEFAGIKPTEMGPTEVSPQRQLPGYAEVVPRAEFGGAGEVPKKPVGFGEAKIPKELQPLAQEARRAQNADEFVQSLQGTNANEQLYKWDIEINKNFTETAGKKYPIRGWFDIAKDFYKENNKITSLEPLAIEARKYKSAEEFVKAQFSKKGLFHGTYDEWKTLQNKPLFLASAEDYAKSYGDIVKEYVPKEGKTLDLTLAGTTSFKGGKSIDNIAKFAPIFKDIIGGEKRWVEIEKTIKSIPESVRQEMRGSYGDVKLQPLIDYTKNLPETDIKRIWEDWNDYRFVKSQSREAVYSRWDKVLKYAKEKGYDFVKHTGEDEAKTYTFPETIALNPTKSLLTKSQLTDIWNKAVKVPPSDVGRQISETPKGSKIEVVDKNIFPQKSVSSESIISQEQKIGNAEAELDVNDTTDSIKDAGLPIEEKTELITTRKFKQTNEWRAFAKYAEERLQLKDIHPAILSRHISMTAERVAEFLDGKINGEVYKKIVKPVYDSAEKVNKEAELIKKEFDKFKILEGSSADRNASLYAQKKLDKAMPQEMAVAKYVRNKYDEFLVRLNAIREKLGVEPIPKRADYITHINELNVLSELFGGLDRVSVKGLIGKLKNELLDQHADWTDARAFDAAKRRVEGTTGIGQYIDVRQPSFKFAKQRLNDYEKNPSIVKSFSAYTQPALRYIHQAENVARNKAFKDVLPANAKEFIRLWNTEQVAGRVPPSFLNPTSKRILSTIKGTLGSNTILGNLATTMMQLTSFPQVFAMAGIKNTFYGICKRIVNYISKDSSMWNVSRSKALRNLDIDIGLGDSVIDKLLVQIGKINVIRNPAARTRQAIDFGRNILMGIMEMADQFTVGASYEAFYRKAVLDGLDIDTAKEYADIMTGKTQANYFKEALPPFLNTFEGKTIGQFGTYTMNQWEMIRKDLGKEFGKDKSGKNLKSMFKAFLVFLTTAYFIDAFSEKTFGRQPYDVKSLTDETIKLAMGESDFGKEAGAVLNTVASYIPFMGSVKYKSMPPVFDFGSDVVSAILGSGSTQQTAINNLSEKWIYNILLPYGGNQIRKTLQGIQATTGNDLPFVKNTSSKINIESNLDEARAILFGVSATQASIDYYNKPNGKESTNGLPSLPKIQKLPSLPKLPKL